MPQRHNTCIRLLVWMKVRSVNATLIWDQHADLSIMFRVTEVAACKVSGSPSCISPNFFPYSTAARTIS